MSNQAPQPHPPDRPIPVRYGFTIVNGGRSVSRIARAPCIRRALVLTGKTEDHIHCWMGPSHGHTGRRIERISGRTMTDQQGWQPGNRGDVEGWI